MTDMNEARKQNALMINHLLTMLEFHEGGYSELQKQLLIAFSFGMVYAKGFLEQLSPQDIHALTISMLIDVFFFTPERSGAISDFLITAASDPNFHDTVNAVIHQGINGHKQWSTGNYKDVLDNIKKIFINVE